jgi:type IX secretion system PorP/SprF family membrane protein
MLLLLPFVLQGQTDIQMSQHMFNRTTYNPASTGASRYVNIYGHWRDQWQGFYGAPQTMYLTAHSYFPELKSGLGLLAINDKLGFEKNMLFKLSYAYHIHLTSDSYISLGLSAGVLNRNLDWAKIRAEDPNAPNLPGEPENKWTADFDFGVEYNRERLTLGISVTHLNRTADEAKYDNMGHHFYGYVKYKFGMGVDFDLVPALFAQNSKKSTHIESNLVLFYRNRAWIGVSYRVDEKIASESVVGILGIDLFDFLRVGYSFDYNIGKIGENANNTHEIMLGIRLNRPQKIYAKSPRFFE